MAASDPIVAGDARFVAAGAPVAVAPPQALERLRPFTTVARAIARFHEEQIGPILWAFVVLGLLVAFFLGHVVGTRHVAGAKVGDAAGTAVRSVANVETAVVELD